VIPHPVTEWVEYENRLAKHWELREFPRGPKPLKNPLLDRPSCGFENW
jgi:hypothetical protein